MTPERLANIPPALAGPACEVTRRLQAAGHQAVWAGGAVRDLLRGATPKDIDVATSARPEQVLALFPDAKPIGKAFGVVLVRVGEVSIEVATFRTDLAYEDGRRPTAVTFASAEEDARRRDFTINGMFYDPLADCITDYVGGEADLAARVLRAIGDPAARFAEDHLRMLRAVRFAAVLSLAVDPATAAAIRSAAPRIAHISAERIQQELNRILMEAPRPSLAFRLLSELGLLRVILPEVDALRGVEQPPEFHPEGDVFEHTLLMLDMMQCRSLPLAYAVLLHDVGKPPTFRVSLEPDGRTRIRFDSHDRVGAEMAVTILERLRLPRQLIEEVAHCVRQHMKFMHVQQMRPGKLRQLVGAATFPVELELHRVDCLSSHRDLSNYNFLVAFVEKLRAEPALPPPLVSGHDVLALGVRPGPDVGRWRAAVYEAQLEGRFADREAGLAWLDARLAAGPEP